MTRTTDIRLAKAYRADDRATADAWRRQRTEIPSVATKPGTRPGVRVDTIRRLILRRA